MTERPILFSGPMVRAILSGQKTQTRRLIRPQPPTPFLGGSSAVFDRGVFEFIVSLEPQLKHFPKAEPRQRIACPYGIPGDRLWVRETWGWRGSGWNNHKPLVADYDIAYRADGARKRFVMGSNLSPEGPPPGLPKGPKQKPGQSIGDFYDVTLTAFWKSWRHSIHMPRWASRLTLEVLSVRVERLQEISEDDAKAEGVELAPFCKSGRPAGMEHVEAFEDLWDSINGKRASWESNPWVWCVEFRRVP